MAPFTSFVFDGTATTGFQADERNVRHDTSLEMRDQHILSGGSKLDNGLYLFYDCGRSCHAKFFTDFAFDGLGDFRVLFEVLLGILSSLTDTVTAE